MNVLDYLDFCSVVSKQFEDLEQLGEVRCARGWRTGYGSEYLDLDEKYFSQISQKVAAGSAV